jgi:hypothetical protein
MDEKIREKRLKVYTHRRKHRDTILGAMRRLPCTGIKRNKAEGKGTLA